MTLKLYRQKRDFTQTPEPPPDKHGSETGRFVIQKHAASHLHYDFRLQIGGALKSWAVPKGIPYIKGERRLAIQVEDHPVSYIDFEGTIPKGQYGGGTVMVWDYGTFTPDSTHPAKDLEQGKLHITLQGQKLTGQWRLVRMADGKQWLLIKSEASMKPLTAKADDTSALTGRSMKQISENQIPDAKHTPAPVRPPKPKTARRQKLLAFIEPMKALLVLHPPVGDDWLYEVKFDGFRALAFKNRESLQLLSRNNKDFNDKFPDVVRSLSQLPTQNAVLDGEICALDARGRSSFQALQAYQLGEEKPPLVYYAFDLLWLDGRDLRSQPLEDRQHLLHTLLQNPPQGVSLSEPFDEPPLTLLKHARKLGLEGLIGKRKGSLYEPGRRSGAWIKLKLHAQQEFVIGGFTPPSGSRTHFGALAVGVREGKQWLFTGKVGTGFNDKTLADLHARMMKHTADTCPFSNLPAPRQARYGQTLTASQMARCQWLKPVLVAQIKFSGWTRDGMLRHPVFLGMRDDKPASEVVRERTSEP